MEEIEFNFENYTEIEQFLSDNKERQESIEEYALEYEGTEEGRKLRDLQIGQRKDYTQGATNVSAEKIKIQYQKKIVNTAVSFLFGDAPTIHANDAESTNAQGILKVFKDNRINNKLQDFAEAVMSTTIGVFIFSKNDEGDIKGRFYNHEQGKFTPQYDVYGDLIAFYWEFLIGEVEHIWVFTPEQIHQFADKRFVKSEAHDFGVIPVVFVDQKEPEWFGVKEMIDRLEMLVSKLSASNNYFAFPILKLIGGTEKDEEGNDVPLIDISDDGKSLLLGHARHDNQVIQADAEFLQRDTGVDSIKLEKELLQEFIHSISQTPDLSFDNVKGIGAISGRALILMLQDAINKAKRKRGSYQTAIERILSVIKNGLNIIDDELSFEIEFNYSIPEDVKEQIETLYAATGGKATMSQELGVQHNPYVKNAGEELEKMQAESRAGLGESFNI